MTPRDRLVLIIVLAVACLGAGWFFVVAPKRQQAAQLASQLSSAQSQLDSARQQVLGEESQRSQYPTYYTEVERLGEAVPADDSVPSLLYQLQTAAAAAHVDFRSIQVSNTSGTSPAPVPAPAPATPTSGSTSTTATTPATGSTTPGATPGTAASGTATPGASSSPAPGAASTTGLPPGVAVGPAGFPSEQFTFTFRANFFHLSDFLNRIQQFVVTSGDGIQVSGRLMTLNALSFQAGPTGFPTIEASVSATTYLLPASQGLTNGAGPTGPAGTAGTPAPAAPASNPTPTATIAPSIR